MGRRPEYFERALNFKNNNKLQIEKMQEGKADFDRELEERLRHYK